MLFRIKSREYLERARADCMLPHINAGMLDMAGSILPGELVRDTATVLAGDHCWNADLVERVQIKTAAETDAAPGQALREALLANAEALQVLRDSLPLEAKCLLGVKAGELHLAEGEISLGEDYVGATSLRVTARWLNDLADGLEAVEAAKAAKAKDTQGGGIGDV